MRLVFPNGEHGQVLLASGANRIGSEDSAAVVLHQPGVEARHCEIRVGGTGATLVPEAGAEVQVNGKPVHELIALRSGDVLGIGPVLARVVALQAASGQAAEAGQADTDATRIRPAVPKLVLRGVTTPVFGKVFPLHGPQVLGRSPDCDLPIESDEVSRRHVRLVPQGDSVLVEDLDSANGTYIDGRRVESGELRPGQELRLDSVRFLLVAPGQARAPQPAAAGPLPPASRSRWLGIAVVVVSLLVIGALVMGRGL
jgi:pSer/pThr/pTyr-binding forkhead associated (FHA) protein